MKHNGCVVVSKIYMIRLEENDFGQLVDGLESRAEAWEKTAEYHRTGESPPGFVVGECNSPDEAAKIAAHFRSIIAKIEKQISAQL